MAKKKDYIRFALYLDEEFLTKINERADCNVSLFSHLYTSDLLSYGLHKVRIQGFGENFEFWKFTYWLSMKAKRINSTELVGASSWNRIRDDIGGIGLRSNNINDKLSTSIYCTKFWLFGSYRNGNAQLEVKFGYYKETIDVSINEKLSLIHVSSDLKYTFDDLVITSLTKGVDVDCIYYLDEPPPQTSMFSPSELFTFSKKFSNSIQSNRLSLHQNQI